MCANYIPSTHDQLRQHFQVAPPDSEYKAESFPGYMSPLIRPPRADALPGDRSCALGMFGMVPHWADEKLARQTYNARAETVATKPSFRHAFKHGQFCVIPAASFYEPNYESGKAERWEITAANGEPLGIAGIWDYKAADDKGLPLLSFSMLTINADGHPLMQRFHKPVDEKRMLVILRPDQYDDWLHCPVDEVSVFLERYPADALTAHPAPRNLQKTVQGSLL
jgi:putative SOS response-associated peptidase YedK